MQTATARTNPRSLSNEIETVAWSDFLATDFDWRQGQHVTILGTTDGGKSTIMKAILPARRYRVVFACKPKDPLISGLRAEGYEIIRNWPPHPHIERCVFWPKIEKMSDANTQRMAFYSALYDIYERGGWCVAFDEAAYLARTLGLGHVLKFFYEQARTLNVSVVTLSQRPKEIPLLAYSCARHIFLLRETDAVNLKRLQEISGVNSAVVKEIVPTLGQWEALYINCRTGEMRITKVEKGGKT
jgi:hypothetical protein